MQYLRKFSVNVFTLALVMAVLFWMLDTIVDAYVFEEYSFRESLLPYAHPAEFWMRSIVVLLIILIGVIGRRSLKTQAGIEKALRHEIDARENAQQALVINESVIHELYEIASDLYTPFEQRMQHLLELGVRFFGMQTGTLSRVEGKDYRVLNVVSPFQEIKPGTTFTLSDSYCQLTLQSDGPLALESADERGGGTHPVNAEFDIQAYIGIKISANNRVFGTLGFSSTKALNRPFRRAELDFIELFGSWVGREMHRITVDTELRQAAAVFDNTNEGIILMDLNMIIVAVNSAFSDIMGYSSEDVLGKKLDYLKSEIENENHYCGMWDDFKRKGKWQGELSKQHKNGDLIPIWANCSIIYDEQNQPVNYLTVFSNISSIKQYEEKLKYMAHHDSLTGMSNRLSFMPALEHALEKSRRHKNTVALLFVDIDNFKAVNDNMGHAVGDTLLTMIASRLKETLRAEDTVARLGGDEFVVVLEDAGDILHIKNVADKILRQLVESYHVEQTYLNATCSIGIALYPEHADCSDSLIKAADAAMYCAKKSGKNQYAIYS